MRDIVSPAFWEDFAKTQRLPPTGVPTHLEGLNAICRDAGGGIGFGKGWFVTVGGNPGYGKSIFALNLASAALNAGEQVAYVSVEMSIDQVAARFYSIHSGAPIYKLERGSFDEEQWRRAREYMEGCRPIYVPTQVDGKWESVVEFVENANDQGCEYFIIDYLQLIQCGDEESINKAMTHLVTDLRAWAINNECTIIALSQFNRQTSSEYNVRPRSQGLWGGMILEASSDQVILLDHSRYRRAENGKTAKTWVLADKNRHGPTGDIPVEWDYRNLRMREAQPDEVTEWPGGR